MKDNGATPFFKGVECPYKGGKPFKWALCTSVNDEIIHGIPNDKKLVEGDLLCVDLGVYKNGFHSDAGRTYGVGKISCNVTNKCSKRCILLVLMKLNQVKE